MTYLQKFKEKFPGMSEEQIIEKCCPDEVCMEAVSPCTQSNFYPNMDKDPCRKCWER
jgi:hypothetical protein